MIINNYPIVKNVYSPKSVSLPVQKQSQGYCSDSRGILDSLHFLGNVNKTAVQKSIDIPIKDDEEFNEVMERVYSAKTLGGNVLWIEKDYREQWETYKNASEIEMGLLPYCGEADNCDLINQYLSGRLNNPAVVRGQGHHFPENIDSCVDMVRALDYSLKNLDKEFGTYQGLVFREGYMDEGNGQFYSTTKNPSVLKYEGSNINNFDSQRQHSVIRLKNGHKIYEFQAKMGSDFAAGEEEVLASRNAKFKKVAPEDMDEELLKGREQFASNLFVGAEDIISGKIETETPYTREQLLDMIDVYDQI